MNKKVQIKNPKNSRRKAYPASERRMTKDLNQKGPNTDSFFFEPLFTQVTRKPITEKKETTIPDQKLINPGPGAEKVPCSYWRESKDITIPMPKKNKEAPWSLSNLTMASTLFSEAKFLDRFTFFIHDFLYKLF